MNQTLNPNLTGRTYRIESIDVLRGLVMVIMALDHTRDLINRDANIFEPLNLSVTTPVFFFTRWITHFCAPIFVFLSGASIYLQSLRKSKKELSSFLIKRGVWLIFVDLIIMSLGITFDIYFSTFIMQVIWAIGISMVILGLLIWLPFQVIGVLGLVIVLGHNLLDFHEKKAQDLSVWYKILHVPAFLPVGHGFSFFEFYPFLPWTGLMLVGYASGPWLARLHEPAMRKKILLGGIGIILFFIILRYTNVYGDIQTWSHQKNSLYTFLSFINTRKYPPSLLYMCMTIGPAFVFLGLVTKTRSAVAQFFKTYGSVPFFYYVLHFYLIHLVAAVLFLGRGHTIAQGIKGEPNIPTHFVVAGEGLSLGMTYVVWILIVLALYPLCKWYGKYKKMNQHWWLSYL